MVKNLLRPIFTLSLFALTACSSVHFEPSATVIDNRPYPLVERRPVTVPIRPLPLNRNEVMQYGRFKVVQNNNGEQQILGGRFTPSLLLPLMATSLHVIFIDYTTKELSYYQKNGMGGYSPIIGFAVVTPAADSLRFEVVRGRVTKIDTAPVWCPMHGARTKYPGLPPGCLPFGHPQNAMGAAKFEIAWANIRGFEAIRLHGTNGYSGNFWEEETLGCTRLHNDAIKELITILGPQAVWEGIEVILYRGKR